MEETRIRALILEEIQGIIAQIVDETEGTYSPMVVAAKSVGEIVAKRLENINDNQSEDTEIGKDPV
ncbi:MAG TPA: hypothetical protein VIL74_21685 [Pyrinomonadaceae bacterium]|jgi:acetyl-CoA carboxylase alpha subunit